MTADYCIFFYVQRSCVLVCSHLLSDDLYMYSLWHHNGLISRTALVGTFTEK